MKKRISLETILKYTFATVFSIAVVGSVAMCIYCWIRYGSSTINEVPNWALWFMFGNRK